MLELHFLKVRVVLLSISVFLIGFCQAQTWTSNPALNQYTNCNAQPQVVCTNLTPNVTFLATTSTTLILKAKVTSLSSTNMEPMGRSYF